MCNIFRKKTASAGRKSAASDGEDRVEGLENADPSTLMSGVQTPRDEGGKGKKKGKKKKKKLSKSEKAHVSPFVGWFYVLKYY